MSTRLYNVSALTDPTSPLVIYLPPAGTHLRTTHPSIPPFLFSKHGALASVNYRWSIPHTGRSRETQPLTSHPSYTNHPFPTPLHDTLHAYTYLIEKILPAFVPQPSSPTRGSSPFSTPLRSSRDPQRPILIYGSYLGGALATSLALTESFASRLRPNRIIGVITQDAIFDWTEIATTKTPTETSEHPAQVEGEIWQNGAWDETTLHSLKHSLFTRPESCFDSFVSPVLFFHTAGAAPASRWPSSYVVEEEDTGILDDMAGFTISDETGEISALSPNPAENQNPNPTPGKKVTEMEIETTRAAHVKFPPRDSNLKIPRALFLTSPSSSSTTSEETGEKSNSPKSAMGKGITPKAQAEEMARLMRRSIVMHEFKDRVQWDEDADPHAASEERVQVREVGDETGDGRKREELEVREWIEDSLGYS